MLAVAPAQRRRAATSCAPATASRPPSLGTFTGDGVLRVRHGDDDGRSTSTRAFLHDGRPQRDDGRRRCPRPDRDARRRAGVRRCRGRRCSPCSPTRTSPRKASVIRRYDHEILGGTVVRPLVGRRRRRAMPTASCSPSRRDTHGIAIGIGVNPWYGQLDPERMAHAVVDEAIRNVVAVGADPDRVALLDNFSWGDPRRPSTLGELVAAVLGCCDASLAIAAPFVSGKDSLNNEYLGADGSRHAVPPTLVITAVAHVPDAARWSPRT